MCILTQNEVIKIKENKRSFILYNDYLQHIRLLSMEERGELMTAVFEYTCEGELTIKLSPCAAMAFSFIKRNLDDDLEKYNSVCQRNQQNGKKGGRPRKEEPTGESGCFSEKETCFFEEPKITERFSGKPKKTDTDTVTDTESSLYPPIAPRTADGTKNETSPLTKTSSKLLPLQSPKGDD